MGNAAAFRMGAQWYDDAQTRERQAMLDAQSAEEFDQKRQQWQREEGARTQLRKTVEEMNTAPANVDPMESLYGYGLTRPAQQGQPSPLPVQPPPPIRPDDTGASYGSASAGSPTPQATGLRPQMAAPPSASVDLRSQPAPSAAPPQAQPRNADNPQQMYVQQRRNELLQLARYAEAQGDGKTVFLANQELGKLKQSSASAALANQVLNLSDAQMGELARNVTSTKANKYEIDFDPRTGLSTVKLGKANVEMDRNQFADFFAAKDRLKNGDFTALDVLKGIDKELAGAVADSLKISGDVAKINNDAATRRANMTDQAAGRADAAARTRIAGAHLGIARNAAGKPDYVELQDTATGALRLFDQKQLPIKNGELQLPAGMALPSRQPPQQIDLQAIERRAAALEGKPMQGLSKAGKAQVYDADTAYQAARQQLYGQSGATPDNSETGRRLAARAANAANGQPPAGQSPLAEPTPPAQGKYRVISQMGPDAAHVMLSSGEIRPMSYQQLQDYKFQPE